jgi:tripartite-type tricarboxylate transporter receptor subunit TctC
MKSVRNKKRIVIGMATVAAVAVLLTVGMVGIGSAATWPEKGKVLTFYIASGAGGGSDMAGRAMSTFLEKELGVKIVIINKPGAGSQIGVTEFLAKSGTDGYTMVMANAPVCIAPYVDPDRKAPYNYNKDIILAVNYAFSPCAVAVKKGGKYKTLKDFMEAVRANPGKISGTASGPLVQNDLAMALVEKTVGVKLAHMFFDSQGEQRACLLGGHCDAEFNNDFELIAGQKSGEIETLAIFDKQPVASLPGVPTAESLGYNIYMSAGYGLGFKTGTPKAVIDTVAAAVERAAKTPEMQTMFGKMGLGIRVMTGKDFADYWKYQEDVVKDVIAGMKKEGKK